MPVILPHATVPSMLPCLFALAAADDLSFGYVPSPGPNENPALLVTPARAITSMYVKCDVGGKPYEWNKKGLAADSQVRFEWTRNTSVTHADCFLRTNFAGGDVTENEVPIDYTYQTQLSIDLSRASADIEKRTLTVKVTAPVNQAEIIAYGAHKVVLDQSTVPVSGGPGEIEVPFSGDPGEIVLLEVKLSSGNAWAGFTYSPWFLDIPHDDVLFPSDSADIPADEVWKLKATLERLDDVIEKYGAIVPVKLYIAGCTDTVGDSGHNSELSSRRAQAIGRWLRASGYSSPIYYHGFGEALQAVQTGDGVDMQANRRTLYMVGANPPPAGSGIPGVGWKAL